MVKTRAQSIPVKPRLASQNVGSECLNYFLHGFEHVRKWPNLDVPVKGAMWAPDESQFGGDVAPASADAPSPPFFTAIQQQLGLRLEATKGPVEALVVDVAERPSAN